MRTLVTLLLLPVALPVHGQGTVLTGDVQGADGDPVAGAVVVTSLGGEAVTDPYGRDELALDVPADAPSFHVTAVANRGGASVAGTVLVDPAAGAAGRAGTVVLAATAGFAPSWIPTFGGVDDSVLGSASGCGSADGSVPDSVPRWSQRRRWSGAMFRIAGPVPRR